MIAPFATQPLSESTRMFSETQGFIGYAKHLVPAEISAPRQRRTEGAHAELEQFGALFGACVAMRNLFRTLERLAATSASVMILGESGSGKELVANTIHQLSERKSRAFVAINCGAIP